MHAYSGMGTRCAVYASTIQWDTEDQYTGTNVLTKDQSYGLMGNTMNEQKNNPMDTRYLCVQRTNPMVIGCTNRGPIL